MPYLFDAAQEELEIEFNSRFDYIQEAYGATAIDGEVEAFYDDCDHLEREGRPVPTFEEWKRAKNLRVRMPVILQGMRRPPSAWDFSCRVNTDDIPF